MVLNLNDVSVIEQLMKETNQKWRTCLRKQYSVFACRMPKDLIFANKLEQPDSFNAMKTILGKYIATIDECNKHPDLMHILNKYGFYQTDGNCITLCGTVGELWTVKEEKLKSVYRRPTGDVINFVPKGWFQITRASETTACAVGVYIPKQYVGKYQTSWGQVLWVNNPKSDGHNNGDILVAPLINGQPNLTDCSPTNNAVFAQTYDLAVGNWEELDIKTKDINSFSLEECKKFYSFANTFE